MAQDSSPVCGLRTQSPSTSSRGQVLTLLSSWAWLWEGVQTWLLPWKSCFNYGVEFLSSKGPTKATKPRGVWSGQPPGQGRIPANWIGLEGGEIFCVEKERTLGRDRWRDIQDNS